MLEWERKIYNIESQSRTNHFKIAPTNYNIPLAIVKSSFFFFFFHCLHLALFIALCSTLQALTLTMCVSGTGVWMKHRSEEALILSALRKTRCQWLSQHPTEPLFAGVYNVYGVKSGLLGYIHCSLQVNVRSTLAIIDNQGHSNLHLHGFSLCLPLSDVSCKARCISGALSARTNLSVSTSAQLAVGKLGMFSRQTHGAIFQSYVWVHQILS